MKKPHHHSTIETLHDTKVETLGLLISSIFITKVCHQHPT